MVHFLFKVDMSVSIRPSQSWLSTDDILDIASCVLSEINTEVAQKAASLIDDSDFDSLVTLRVDPKDYNNPHTFALDYQASSLMRKCGFLKTSFNRREAAEETFKKAESQCEETNLKFDKLCYGSANEHRESVSELGNLFGCLMKAKDIVHRILGPVPQLDDFRFGPGSTSLIKGSITTPRKYSREIHVTPEMYAYWRDVCGVSWCKLVDEVHLVSGSTVSFVPKDATTDRTIGIEPHLNIYAQLGVGGMMRRRFKPWVDLTVGQEGNQYLAKIAITAELATIDFKSASDTVSRGLVNFLLPPQWVELLDRVRSHRYLLGDDECVFHKHSSMGNGYTFELESIIFYALARAVCWNGHSFFADVVSSYGDDVILPRHFAKSFTDLAEWCGFTVNQGKSFLSGSFYESCGHDYFDGVNVRPVFWKENTPTTIFKLHNDIRRMSNRLRLPKLQNLADSIRLAAPNREIRHCLIPDGYGDVGFVVPWDVATPSVLKLGKGFDGFSTKALKFRSDKLDHSKSRSGLLAALDTGSEVSLSPIRARGVYQVGRLETFGSWDDIRH